VKAAAYCNGDDVFLAWVLPETAKCWGVAIWRNVERASGEQDGNYLWNYVGFKGDKVNPSDRRRSNEWPFQRYTWTDHDVDEGDTVSYTICPVLKVGQKLKPDTIGATTIGPVNVTSHAAGIDAYFNRGLLLSQFVARNLPPNFTTSDLSKLKKKLEKQTNELRTFLTGQLGARLLQLLDEAKANDWHIYAALYELDDDALIGRLEALGMHAHLVLSNGSDKTTGHDGNARAAKKLENIVDLNRRMLWSEGLGHNKFLVLAESPTKPVAVWTGSTNWATTALCTQVNNGILIEDPALAGIYLKQWKLLRDDHHLDVKGKEKHFGPALMASNDVPKTISAGSKRWTAQFTRTSAGQDLEAAATLINDAKDAILFLMFEPGTSGLRQVVEARLSPASPHYDADLYVHGVVNTLEPPKGKKKPQEVMVDIVSRGAIKSEPFGLRIVEPDGIRDLPGWATEVTRRDFILGQGGVIGHAIIHSKVLVLDPFTKPVVITGSHNFSATASNANDENLLIVKGNKALAERYAVNILSVYQHYRWRAYVRQSMGEHKSPWEHLTKSPSWQKKQPEHDRELAFWVR
jgi:phosphatidylserine/phosphatidylglycerophosphate/cardiolipin synthase-like enzyme